MLRTAKRLQSRAVNHHNFPGIPPLVWIVDQSSTNGILSNVIPFVSVAFIVAENMIKTAAARSAMSLPTQYVSRELVSAFLPMARVENRRVRGGKDERDRASPCIGRRQYCEPSTPARRTRRMPRAPIGREQFPPLVCTKCDEEQGIVSEDPPQPRRKFWIFVHPSFVAASLWEAECRCSLAVRHVAHKSTATEVGMRFTELKPPSKETSANTSFTTYVGP